MRRRHDAVSGCGRCVIVVILSMYGPRVRRIRTAGAAWSSGSKIRDDDDGMSRRDIRDAEPGPLPSQPYTERAAFAALALHLILRQRIFSVIFVCFC